MSATSDQVSHKAFDSTDQQTSYIYAPDSVTGADSQRPRKRRKVSKHAAEVQPKEEADNFRFPALFGGRESPKCIERRQQLFQNSWAKADARIQTVLKESNEVTLRQVTDFVGKSIPLEHRDQLPTGLIVTGPNIASQELLFDQITAELRDHKDYIVVTLRSEDAPNLKTVLKKIIRGSCQNTDEDDEGFGGVLLEKGRKLLNYDLQILRNHIKPLATQKVVISFQDSEAFDSFLLTEILCLFSSWLDRIPFVVLFGIATSVELFHERLPRQAIRCLHGEQFDVEQTGKTLEKIFLRVVASQDAPLRMGSSLVAALMQRQHDHVQSLQAFVSALKYAYMCHFYANPLSVLHGKVDDLEDLLNELQPEHLEAIRMLPSFRTRVENLLEIDELSLARDLIESDEILLEDITTILQDLDKDNSESLANGNIKTLLISLTLLSTAATTLKTGSFEYSELYVKAFGGSLNDSDLVSRILDSVRVLTPFTAQTLLQQLDSNMASGIEEIGDNGGIIADMMEKAHSKLRSIANEIKVLDDGKDNLRTKYSLQNKTLRTTVIAQKVQLSKAQSTLSKDDVAYTDIIDILVELLASLFRFPNPQDMFLNEIWLYDSKSPYREVFTPKPRHATERALCVPHDYLGCTCCRASEEGLSGSQPPTAILYQLYLETGGLINVFDLWSAFFAIVGGEEGNGCGERQALMLFYRGLADLNLMGMVKQSRKKTDHIAKLAWRGL